MKILDFFFRASLWLVLLSFLAFIFIAITIVFFSGPKTSENIVHSTLVGESFGEITRVRLDIPESYFSDNENLEKSSAIIGVHSLYLWAFYPEMTGFRSGGQKKHPTMVIPHTKIKLFLDVARNEGKKNIAQRHWKFDSGSYNFPKNFIEKELFVDAKGNKVYFIRHDQNKNKMFSAYSRNGEIFLFIRCSKSVIWYCRAYKSYENILDIEFHFPRRPFGNDFVELSDKIDELMDQFIVHDNKVVKPN